MSEPLVDAAIKSLRLAAQASREYYGEPLLVAYSGGKDSDVLAKLCEIGKVDCEFVHSLTTADAPQTVAHVKRTFARLERAGYKCKLQLPRYKGERTTMWKLIPLKGYPPTRLARYCCDYLKETSGKHRMCALGVRADESSARKARGEFEVLFRDKAKRGNWDYSAASEAIESARELPEVFDCNLVTNMKRRGDTAVNPLIAWTEADVWDFLHDTRTDVCDLYSMGYKRVGCILCPLGGYASMQREGADFPKYRRAYIRAFDKMIEKRKQDGKKCDWESGEEVYHWWVRDGVIPGQMSLELEEVKDD